jgi:uncharacterized protein YoxC
MDIDDYLELSDIFMYFVPRKKDVEVKQEHVDMLFVLLNKLLDDIKIKMAELPPDVDQVRELFFIVESLMRIKKQYILRVAKFKDSLQRIQNYDQY